MTSLVKLSLSTNFNLFTGQYFNIAEAYRLFYVNILSIMNFAFDKSL